MKVTSQKSIVDQQAETSITTPKLFESVPFSQLQPGMVIGTVRDDLLTIKTIVPESATLDGQGYVYFHSLQAQAEQGATGREWDERNVTGSYPSKLLQLPETDTEPEANDDSQTVRANLRHQSRQEFQATSPLEQAKSLAYEAFQCDPALDSIEFDLVGDGGRPLIWLVFEPTADNPDMSRCTMENYPNKPEGFPDLGSASGAIRDQFVDTHDSILLTRESMEIQYLFKQLRRRDSVIRESGKMPIVAIGDKTGIAQHREGSWLLLHYAKATDRVSHEIESIPSFVVLEMLKEEAKRVELESPQPSPSEPHVQEVQEAEAKHAPGFGITRTLLITQLVEAIQKDGGLVIPEDRQQTKFGPAVTAWANEVADVITKGSEAVSQASSRIAAMESALTIADDALATIHDTNLWVHENEPTDWTERVDHLTTNAIDTVRKVVPRG